MKTLKIILAFLTFSLVAISCNKDDEGTKAAPSVSEIKFTEDNPALPITPTIASYDVVLMDKLKDKIYVVVKKTNTNSCFFYSYDVKDTTVKSLAAPTHDILSNSGGETGILTSDGNDELNAINIKERAIYSVSQDQWFYTKTNPSYFAPFASSCTKNTNFTMFYAGNAYGGTSFRFRGSGTDWSILSDTPYEVAYPGLAIHENFIYMIGNESSGPYQNKFSIFNINTNTWQKQADVNFNYAASSFAHTAVVLKDRYLAVYSREGFIRLYDIVKKEWSSKNNIELDYASDQSNFNLFTDSSDSRILYLAYTKYGEFRIKRFTINI